jgi:hypothetical protein
LKKISAFVVLCLALSSLTYGQTREITPKVIQFTGVIFANDSASIVPGVHVYVPQGGRGTTTNPYGFFSMPVLEGDSIIFSAVGFDKTYYIIPSHKDPNSLKLVVYLTEDIFYLEDVAIFPYPSEATFKAAILATRLPNEFDQSNLNVWMNSEVMREMYRNQVNSGNANFRNAMNEQMNYNRYEYQPAANNYLNPFAWSSFIRSLKKN